MPAPWGCGWGGVETPTHPRGLGRSAPTTPGKTGRQEQMNHQQAGDEFIGRQKPPPLLTDRFTAGYTNGVVKIKNPLVSFKATGRLGPISFKKSRATNIAEKTPVVPDAKSLAQLSWRHMYQKAVALWHALSADEKQDWESSARPRHMTGFAWFMSQALKPNPGLYLPLQGGTMSGDIDMAKHRILKLPAPADAQETFRLSDYTTYVLPNLLREGARVYHSATQAIPDITWTTLAFNSERWDNDAIHDNVTNNSRLTCKTAGKYIIVFHGYLSTNATGQREARIMLNGTTRIGYASMAAKLNLFPGFVVSTIYDLAVTDFVEASIYQDSGVPLTIANTPQYGAEFMMQRIGI